MIFATEGAVAAIALGFLVAATVQRMNTSSNALVGSLTTLTAKFVAALVASVSRILKKTPEPSTSIALFENVFVLILLHLLRSPLKTTFS